MKLKFKRVKQLTGSYCGPATIEMMLSSLGVEVNQEVLVDACGSRKTVMKLGIPLPDLAKGVKKLFPDLRLWYKEGSKVDDVQILLNKGYLVGVDWQGVFVRDEYGDDERSWLDETLHRFRRWPELRGSEGHYCVVTKVDPKEGVLRFVDPYGHYAGKERYIAIWEFEERWWDDRIGREGKERGKYVFEDKLAFVISKKNDTALRKLGLKEL